MAAARNMHLTPERDLCAIDFTLSEADLMTGTHDRYARMILASFGLAVNLALIPLEGARGQERQDETQAAAASEPSLWMKKKLEYSRNILAGLASEDFDQIAANAESMQTMSRFEAFIRGKMPGYRSQLQVFQSANEQLIKQAQKDNIDGAALAFTQLTISCVNCHKQLREGRADSPARTPPPAKP
jgi:hypothetical protein